MITSENDRVSTSSSCNPIRFWYKFLLWWTIFTEGIFRTDPASMHNALPLPINFQPDSRGRNPGPSWECSRLASRVELCPCEFLFIWLSERVWVPCRPVELISLSGQKCPSPSKECWNCTSFWFSYVQKSKVGNPFNSSEVEVGFLLTCLVGVLLIALVAVVI